MSKTHRHRARIPRAKFRSQRRMHRHKMARELGQLQDGIGSEFTKLRNLNRERSEAAERSRQARVEFVEDWAGEHDIFT